MAYAAERGYVAVEYKGEWRGMDCYEPFVKEELEPESAYNPPMIGTPQMIFIENGEMRFGTLEEVFAWMDENVDEDDEDEDDEEI